MSTTPADIFHISHFTNRFFSDDELRMYVLYMGDNMCYIYSIQCNTHAIVLLLCFQFNGIKN